MTAHLPFGKYVMFADDVQFLDTGGPRDLETLQQRVETTLDTALKWFTQNRLKINPTKTELLVIRPPGQARTDDLTIRFGTTRMHPSPHATILGVTVDSGLSWEKQVSRVTRRCYSILIGLSKLRHKIPLDTKKLMVESLVFPHIHYCLTAWAGCNLTQRKIIQRVINYGARIVSGQLLREHISPTLQALG